MNRPGTAAPSSEAVKYGGVAEEKKRISDVMYAAKLLAFFSVCCAHTYYNAFAGTPPVLNMLYQFGTFGVAVFFFISGYYFKKERAVKFIRKKAVSLFIPWVFWGCAAYCTRFWDNSAFYFDPLEILRWLSGVGTYLWFLTVLLCLQVLFNLLPDKKSILIVLMGITVLSRIATSAGLWVLPWHLAYNYYLNPLNWMGFFALGKYVSETGTMWPRLRKHPTIVLSACLSVCAVCGFFDPVPTYAGWTNPLIQLLMIPVTLIAADWLRRCRAFITFGKYTLCLYLIHMPLIGKMNTLFQGSCLYALVKPVIVTLVLSCLILIGLKLSEKIRLDRLYCLLTGLKPKKPIDSPRKG